MNIYYGAAASSTAVPPARVFSLFFFAREASKNGNVLFCSRRSQDWDNREVVEIIQMNILTITAFLNKFDSSTRYKLARINEKLSKLERALDFCESAVKSTLGENE